MAEKKNSGGKGRGAKQNEASGEKTRERIAWHTAFADAAKAELVNYLDKLTFEIEHQLNMEPLKIDMLIIKKAPGIVIDKNIGVIFRQHNIVEYKSPTDSLSISDYHKVMAYTHLYISLERLRYTDVTVTFVSYRRPRELIKYLTQSGSSIERRYPGILYVTGASDTIPMQIIVSRELDENDNIWLKNLTDDADAERALRVYENFNRIKDRARILAYMDVFAKANIYAIKEAEEMARTRDMTLEDIFVELGWTKNWEERGVRIGEERGVRIGEERGVRIGEARAKIEMAIALVNDGDSIERAAKMSGIPVEELEKYL